MQYDDKIDYASTIKKRVEALLERKRTANEAALARIGALDTAWRDVNGEIDKALKTGLDGVGAEIAAMKDAKERLKRNVCDGVDKSSYAVAGKVIDAETKVGLPGLTVTLALEDGRDALTAQTSQYGDFFFTLSYEGGRAAAARSPEALLLVGFDVDTIVYREQRSIEQKPGAITHVTVAIECSGRLKQVLEHGKQIKASVDDDAKLVEQRSANFETAYEAFKEIPDTALSRLRVLKRDLSSAPPWEETRIAPPLPTAPPAPPVASPPTKPQPSPSESAPQIKTRYLGNSKAREVHDLKNAKRQCQVDKIPADHRVAFRTLREAVAAKYDYCAYCFGKKQSKR